MTTFKIQLGPQQAFPGWFNVGDILTIDTTGDIPSRSNQLLLIRDGADFRLANTRTDARVRADHLRVELLTLGTPTRVIPRSDALGRVTAIHRAPAPAQDRAGATISTTSIPDYGPPNEPQPQYTVHR